jgi:hypothetical protein
MFGAFLLSESHGWGVGDERSVFETTDFGQTWTRRNCGIRGNIDDVWFINDTLGWAVGEGIYVSRLGATESRITIEPNVDTALICRGDSLLLSAVGPFAPYSWNDGVVAPARIVTEPGRYIVRAYDSLTCETVSDTITVALRSTFRPLITSSSNAICEGDTMTLLLVGPIDSWSWSTGDTSSSIRVATPGRVSCTVIDQAGCRQEASFEVIVNPLPRPLIIPNRRTTICRDEVITLSVDAPYASYRWSNGESNRSFTTSTAGDYLVEVIDQNGCVGRSETITVTVLNIRNQAEFQFASARPSYAIADHDVGGVRCLRVGVLNRSDSTDLVMIAARFKGNVFFSVPQAQFPIVIQPSGVGELTICASAYDVGPMLDTLLFDDTCSTIGIPVSSNGLSIPLSGISRCDLPVESSIVRAGTTWRLRDPYPVPADDRLVLQLSHDGSFSRLVTAIIHDVTGTVVIGPKIVRVDAKMEDQLDVSQLKVGPYVITLTVDGEPLSSYPVIISR